MVLLQLFFYKHHDLLRQSQRTNNKLPPRTQRIHKVQKDRMFVLKIMWIIDAIAQSTFDLVIPNLDKPESSYGRFLQ